MFTLIEDDINNLFINPSPLDLKAYKILLLNKKYIVIFDHIYNVSYFLASEISDLINIHVRRDFLKNLEHSEFKTINREYLLKIQNFSEIYGGSIPNLTLINESGFKKCIYKSKLPYIIDSKDYILDTVSSHIRKIANNKLNKTSIVDTDTLQQILEQNITILKKINDMYEMLDKTFKLSLKINGDY